MMSSILDTLTFSHCQDNLMGKFVDRNTIFKKVQASLFTGLVLDAKQAKIEERI